MRYNHNPFHDSVILFYCGCFCFWPNGTQSVVLEGLKSDPKHTHTQKMASISLEMEAPFSSLVGGLRTLQLTPHQVPCGCLHTHLHHTLLHHTLPPRHTLQPENPPAPPHTHTHTHVDSQRHTHTHTLKETQKDTDAKKHKDRDAHKHRHIRTHRDTDTHRGKD